MSTRKLLIYNLICVMWFSSKGILRSAAAAAAGPRVAFRCQPQSSFGRGGGDPRRAGGSAAGPQRPPREGDARLKGVNKKIVHQPHFGADFQPTLSAGVVFDDPVVTAAKKAAKPAAGQGLIDHLEARMGVMGPISVADYMREVRALILKFLKQNYLKKNTPQAGPPVQ